VNESLANMIYTNSGHTTHLNLIRIRGEGNLWITEKLVTYDGRPVNTVTIMEFRDAKVSHETHYFADPFEPPE
jgi:hypothetical protein